VVTFFAQAVEGDGEALGAESRGGGQRIFNTEAGDETEDMRRPRREFSAKRRRREL